MLNPEDLNYREKRIILAIYEGYSNGGIARKEGVSKKLVEQIIRELKEKIAPEASDRKEFSVRARIVYHAAQAGMFGVKRNV